MCFIALCSSHVSFIGLIDTHSEIVQVVVYRKDGRASRRKQIGHRLFQAGEWKQIRGVSLFPWLPCCADTFSFFLVQLLLTVGVDACVFSSLLAGRTYA